MRRLGEGGEMPLPDIDTAVEWKGRTVIDRDGEKVGTFEEIYLDTETDRPEWASVKTGRFGLKQSFVPLSEATEADEHLQVPWEKQHIEDAPKVDPDGELSQQDEARLYGHYDLEYSKGPSGTGLPERAGADTDQSSDQETQPPPDRQPRGDAGQDAPSEDETVQPARPKSSTGARQDGPQDDIGGGDPSRGAQSGDDLEDVAAETGPRERVRLRKYVVTEHVTRTVPVQREEVRVEREPISGEESD